MQRPKQELQVFNLLAAVAGFGAVALIMLLLVTALGNDRGAMRREEALVTNGLQGRFAEAAHNAIPGVVWDDAVAHLQNKFDLAWTRQNIGDFFSKTDGFEFVMVLNGQERPIYAVDHGVEIQGLERPRGPAGGPGASAESDDLHRMVAAIRLREAQARPDASGVYSAPIQESSVTRWGKGWYSITASLVRSDYGKVKPVGKPAPIVFTGEELDPGFLGGFAHRFLVSNIRLEPPGPRLNPVEAHSSLKDARGRVVAVLTWMPERPGAHLLSVALGPILAIVLLLAVAAIILHRRAIKSAEGLLASEARANHMAMHDGLTGLPNRLLLADRMNHAREQARRTGAAVAVLCIDLDRFKEVNDTYGHHCGDELIKEAARRLSATCRSSDTLARLGGDEFAIVQTEATPRSASVLAERVLEALSGIVNISAGQVTLGCSIGVALIVDPEIEPAEGLRQADMALYRAKDAGRGRSAFFEPEMDAALRTRRLLEADLRHALATPGQLRMAYQPQVDGKGRIVGVEALMRWEHPERGNIAPGLFVGIAEECGLIHILGQFALSEALRDCHRWPGIKVAVNVSAHQLRAPDFVGDVKRLIAESGAHANQIELEITEGILLADDVSTQHVLKRLRDLGFSLALDDFGTGYSSLSYLRRYPVDKIKIDRSFISGLGVDQEADAVVSAIVKLARALNLGVIAEGVETQDQRQRLVAAGCRNIQGFLFAKAQTADEIDAMIRDGVTLSA